MTPTPAQIEAAAYEISTRRHNKEIWSDSIAKAALIAAAEVGDFSGAADFEAKIARNYFGAAAEVDRGVQTGKALTGSLNEVSLGENSESAFHRHTAAAEVGPTDNDLPHCPKCGASEPDWNARYSAEVGEQMPDDTFEHGRLVTIDLCADKIDAMITSINKGYMRPDISLAMQEMGKIRVESLQDAAAAIRALKDK